MNDTTIMNEALSDVAALESVNPWQSYQQWMIDLAAALGYRVDGDNPEIWNLPPDAFAFLEDTNEVVTYEVDGPDEDTAPRRSHLVGGCNIAMRTIRRPLPKGFEIVTLTTNDGKQHRIALRKAIA